MPSTYKTPGVYVEEVSTFPPSVAPVATAIPAFIGYTERAIKNGESLKNTPTKISSFVEFTQFYGGAPDRGVVIRLNAQNQFVKSEFQASVQQYYLYDCLRLFYDNGGGDCYIVSVGSYTDTPDIGTTAPMLTGILGGLKALEKFDEPTMIVSPDATLISSDMYTYQQQALAQCNKLQDRFLIADLLQNDENLANQTFDDRVEQLRNNIGINDLKYGAVYAPWLKSTLSAGLSYRDVLFHRELDNSAPSAGNSQSILLSLTSDDEIRQLVYDLEAAIAATKSLQNSVTPGSGGLVGSNNTGLESELKALADAAGTVVAGFDGATWTDIETELSNAYDKLLDVIAEISNLSQSLPNLVSKIITASPSNSAKFRLSEDITTAQGDAKSAYEALVRHHIENLADLTLISDVSASSSFDAGFTLFGYAGALGTAQVDVNADTANIYDSIAAITSLYAEINSGGTLHTAVDTEGDPAVALTMVETELPSDFAQSVTDEITTILNGLAPGDPIANLTGPLTALGTVVGRVAEDYVTAQGVTLIDDVVNNISTDIDNIISAARLAANTASAGAASGSDIASAIELTSDINNRRADAMFNGVNTALNTITSFYAEVMSAAQTYETMFNGSLSGSFGSYKDYLERAGAEIMTLPPSAAIAGIYTKVDNERGVWKAPANVSLSSVSGPFVNITASEQEDLNVDVNAGKSINAIRSFTGKGILVWGARTLAGNDNEWRYVPVRRFFNFAEESIKKATEQFVFEPNDANTWVRVRAMIENFLILQWRAGALAGAKPEQAFFVKIGLGETMTALDILEGRMIVEIGMAVVRPAEFIILRFSHKMQES